jgi:lipopolysaccharide transport system permease protein
MNPHKPHARSPTALVAAVWQNRRLVLQLTRREVLGRYAGSTGGIAWSLIGPIAMLLVYTFVFSSVFNARWGVEQESTGSFALVLFAGFIVFTVFSEVIGRSPSLIVSNSNLVKRVVFPLEVLSVIALCAALFHAAISIVVLVVGLAMFGMLVPWGLAVLPAVFLPYCLFILGVSWILASIGVFIRDTGQAIGLVITLMLFLSPVFFPISAVPAWLRPWMHLNPLTYPIEQVRNVLVWGRVPDLAGLAIYTIACAAFAWLGFVVFQSTRKGFADVL